MKSSITKWNAGALLALLLLAMGCTTVVRENIISSVNTGIGASIAENPQTQMYEIKAGYIRSQFYSIPTGKKVEAAKAKGKRSSDNLFTNAADRTPNLVAGIRMKSDLRHLLLGMEVSESFAVGETAVMSPAAVAMYIANADSDAKASAAILAATASAQTVKEAPSTQDLTSILPLSNAWLKFAATPKAAKFNAAAQGAGFEDFPHFLLGDPHNPTAAEIATVRAELEKDSEIKAALK